MSFLKGLGHLEFLDRVLVAAEHGRLEMATGCLVFWIHSLFTFTTEGQATCSLMATAAQ